jgi:2-iminobutanoate/2-iminopropanoate deaminase
MSATRKVIESKDAPAAIGPYSQAIGVGHLVFCSGQIPLDATTGALVGGDDVTAQTRQVLRNLDAVLRAAGTDLRHVVKTTIYLADMNDFAAVNSVYGEHFAAEPPARATVEVSRLPRDVKVEIDAIALLP